MSVWPKSPLCIFYPPTQSADISSIVLRMHLFLRLKVPSFDTRFDLKMVHTVAPAYHL